VKLVTSSRNENAKNAFPDKTGIGLRAPHYQDVLDNSPSVGFLEVHSENYFAQGGKPHAYLERIAEQYLLSFHGVGLSLGSTDKLSVSHLSRLKQLNDQYQPILVSEHLSWGSIKGRYLNDLLPLPYTEEALTLMCEHVDIMQNYLQRQCLIENISSYLSFPESSMSEQEFIVALAAKTGCGILLDVNNVYVSSVNHRYDAEQFIADIPAPIVKEFHLAGHVCNTFEDGEILIDSHNKPVCDEVWKLYEYTVRHIGPRPCLIEWDSDLPPLATLVNEAQHADHVVDNIIDHVVTGENHAQSSITTANIF
jgi:uncharacterized protein (UPF0276 family)